LFSGNGYQTCFTDLCRAIPGGDTLQLEFLQVVGGNDRHEKLHQPFVKMWRTASGFFVRSLAGDVISGRAIKFERE
jgi:hypothetical protein